MEVARQTQAKRDYRIVAGLGSTGLSCARYLYARDIPFAVVDSRAQPRGLATLRNEMPGVEFLGSDGPEGLFDGVTEVIVSPGIAMDAPIVTGALAAGVPIVGDIDLFMREADAPVVGITGSNAKSTVTELVGEMARTAGLAVGVGGNLGTPALDLLEPGTELYVLELSSFQLERAGQLGLAVATVLNVSADHLDRHGSMSEYRRAKHQVFAGCKQVVANRDDPQTQPVVPADTRVVTWGLTEPGPGDFGLCLESGDEYLCHGDDVLIPVSELGLAGRHNVANALAALALGHAAGLLLPPMVETLRVFAGLPHRCERVAEVAGVTYVNDSKGTNVGATEAALLGLGGDRDIVLIAGGQGKGADFSRLQAAVSAHCKALVLMGEDAPLLQGGSRRCRPHRPGRLFCRGGWRRERAGRRGRYRPAVAGVRQFRHVQWLRGTRCSLSCAGPAAVGGRVMKWLPDSARSAATGMDVAMVLLGMALMLVGFVAISSASIEFAEWKYGNPWHLSLRHLVYLLAALATGVGCYCIRTEYWLATGWWWLFAALALLILVLIPGVGAERNGAQRWLLLGPFTLQPSEFAKLAVVVYLAGYMVRQEEELRRHPRGFLKPMGVLFVVTLLLLFEPDFGATVIVASTAFGMLFLAGVRLLYALGSGLVVLAAVPLLIILEPYRWQRLVTYLDPWADPYNSGFQLTQSLIAFGRGEWFGVGLGNSVQKLFYLPEAHTDFVFSIWAEETGFVGALAVIALFAALIGRILWSGREAFVAGNKFGAYVCYGVALIFSGQAFINMGVSSGLLPTKGLTLPFVSYGGTSLMMCCAMLGLVLRVDRDSRVVAPGRRRQRRGSAQRTSSGRRARNTGRTL